MGFGARSKESPLINLFSVDGRSHDVKLDFERLAAGYVRQPTGWSIPEAYLGLLVATALADRVYHEEEQAEVLVISRRSRVLSELSMEELAAANDAVNERFEARPSALREACETLPLEMRLSVFGHCVEVALADGELHKSEAQHLKDLVGLMDLVHHEAEQLVEALLITSRY